MDLFDGQESYPGFNAEQQLEEYESVKDLINKKYKCDLTSLQVRSEFEEAYNKVFDSLMSEYPDQIFNIIFVLMDCYNINETKAVRYLNAKNKELIRAFAQSNFNTGYYEKQEREKQRAKLAKKGIILDDYEDVKDLFE